MLLHMAAIEFESFGGPSKNQRGKKHDDNVRCIDSARGRKRSHRKITLAVQLRTAEKKIMDYEYH